MLFPVMITSLTLKIFISFLLIANGVALLWTRIQQKKICNTFVDTCVGEWVLSLDGFEI